MKFEYSRSPLPITPFIDLSVESAHGKRSHERGKIDTGSSITAIPNCLVDSLSLEASGKLRVSSIFDDRMRMLYAINVNVGMHRFGPLAVISLDRDYVLVGRDLINLWDTRLDGKNGTCEISPWSFDPRMTAPKLV